MARMGRDISLAFSASLGNPWATRSSNSANECGTGNSTMTEAIFFKCDNDHKASFGIN